MMPARTSRLRANAAPTGLERCREVGIGAHGQALETIRVLRRDRECAPSVKAGCAIARPGECLAHVRSRTRLVSIRVGEQLHGLCELGLERSLRALKLARALGGRKLGERAVRGAV